MERKRKLYAAKVAVIMGTLPLLLWAFSAGPPSGKAGVPGESNCSTEASCHQGTALNGGGGSVKVTFPGASTYAPGVQQHLVVTISDPTNKYWGFELTARLSSDPKTQAGSFTSTDSFTAVVCGIPPFDNFQDVYLDFGKNQNCPAAKPLAYVQHTLNGFGRPQSGSQQTYEFDWTPPASATGNITIYVAGNAANGNGQPTGDHIYSASYTLTPAGAGNTPSLSAGGVVSAASFQPGIVPGSYVTIFGSNLSPVAFDSWDKTIVNGKLPTSLDGVSVNIGSKPAFVYRIFPTQIDVQAPDAGTGPVPVTVTTPSGTSVAVTANVVAQSPAFFLWPGSQVVATRNADGSWAVKDGTFAGTTTVAAKPGDVLLLWGTGFGPTTPPVAAGVLVPGDQIYNASPVSIKIGTADVQPIYALLSPGYAGLYQVAIQVPASMADGDYALKATVAGASSPDGVVLSVKK